MSELTDAQLIEAVQDTFVAVGTSAGGWDGRGEPAAWIWGIAIRRLTGVLRSRSRWDRDGRVASVGDRPGITGVTDGTILHVDGASGTVRIS